MALLIRSSLTHQEQSRVAAETSGAGKRVLIIGGAGRWALGSPSSWPPKDSQSRSPIRERRFAVPADRRLESDPA